MCIKNYFYIFIRYLKIICPVFPAQGWTIAAEGVVGFGHDVSQSSGHSRPPKEDRGSPRPNQRGSLVSERNKRHILTRRSRRIHAGFASILLTATLAFSAVPIEASASGQQVGTASWYGPGFHGKKTASGKRFNQQALTAAHRSLPLGTRAKVTNLRNGKVVMVTINDRGPHSGGRIIDLSRAAARQLAMGGTAPVRIVAIR